MNKLATSSNAAGAHNFSSLILASTCDWSSGSSRIWAWASNTAASSSDKFLVAASLIAAISSLTAATLLLYKAISASVSSTVVRVTVKSGISNLYALAMA